MRCGSVVALILSSFIANQSVAQQASAHIMVVSVQAKDISVFFGHGYSLRRGSSYAEKWRSCRHQDAAVALP